MAGCIQERAQRILIGIGLSGTKKTYPVFVLPVSPNALPSMRSRNYGDTH